MQPNETKTTFTPGPWRAEGAYVFAGSDCIGIADTDNAPKARMEANARMFAAAPDLYAAGEALANAASDFAANAAIDSEDVDDSDLWDAISDMRAALARANGEG